MSWISDTLKNLTRQLYPDGRAFWMPPGGKLDKLHTALNLSEARAHDDAKSIFNAMIPDNSGFTEADAVQWYRRFGMIYNAGAALADKKLAIYQKMGEPRAVPRNAAQYMQRRFQAAGFDVYVYENSAGETPYDIFGALPVAMYGATQYGYTQYGQNTSRLTKIAKYLEVAKDALFDIGDYRRVFYISGSTITTPAEIPAEREREFRQLVLQLKSSQLVAITYIDYV